MAASTEQSSDLPLRSYPSPPESNADIGPGNSLSAPSRSNSNHPALPPDTPNSVAAQYGEDDNVATPSAAVITERIFGSQSRSRSRSGASSKGQGVFRARDRSNTPTPSRSPAEYRSRSLQRRELSPANRDLNEKVHRFLRSISPPNATDELVKENRSLNERIAALQRTERDLLHDNQELARRLYSTQKRHDTKRQQWKEELVNREKVYETRIKDLESRLARQEEERARITVDRARETTLNDAAITSWFASKTNSWREWVDDFAHRDPSRVRSGLHPLQLQELCDGVKPFVRLTDQGALPEELLTPDNGIRPARVLLQGMLANFIVSETLESPFWVFDVVSVDTLELESPSVPPSNSMSPIGFRMDLAMWNFSIAPPRDVRSPRTMAPPNNPLAEPQDTRKLPQLVTSVQPPSLSVAPKTRLLSQSLPSRQAMEGLYRVLSNVTGGKDNANSSRASILKAFYEGGMSTEVNSIPFTEDARLLAEARLKYSGRLKDRFLRSPARFLLQDQDAAGIEKLERRLVEEIDAALRFSCRLWCRKDTPRVTRLRDLAEMAFNSPSDDMELCQAQAPLCAQPAGSTDTQDGALEYHDDHSVIMVVQPSVSVNPSAGIKKDTKRSNKIWAKASVLVASPKPQAVILSPDPVAVSLVPAQGPKATQDTPSPDTTSINVMIGTLSPPLQSPPAPSVPPNDTQDSGFILLPSIAFKDMPRPLRKQSPRLSFAAALAQPPKAS